MRKHPHAHRWPSCRHGVGWPWVRIRLSGLQLLAQGRLFVLPHSQCELTHCVGFPFGGSASIRLVRHDYARGTAGAESRLKASPRGRSLLPWPTARRPPPAASTLVAFAPSLTRLASQQTTGIVIANVSDSLQHSFCAALADHGRRQMWVFCSAHARNNKQFPGPCDKKPYRGCYVGAWNASFDHLDEFSPMRKALVLPDGHALFNNDVALVFGEAAAKAAKAPGAAPAHQAVMIMEGREEDPHTYPPLSPFAVNTGTDGDLGTSWVLLNRSAFTISGFPKGATGEGTGDAPTLRYDAEQGYYYSIGGGWITNGPARSPNLTAGSWTASQLGPMAVPDARLVSAGLPAMDKTAGDAGINPDMYKAVWRAGSPAEARVWMANTTTWAFGATDPDLCCSDGQGPSFLLNTLSRQGAPSGFSGKSTTFNRLQRSELPLNEWLRSYFPEDTA